MELTREFSKEELERLIKNWDINSPSKRVAKELAFALISEMDKPKVWSDAPEWAVTAMVVWYGKDKRVAYSQNYTRELPKSRIDEIADEAVDKYQRGAVGAGSLTDIIKSAILKYAEENK